jgi:hypothetical protein
MLQTLKIKYLYEHMNIHLQISTNLPIPYRPPDLNQTSYLRWNLIF